MFQEIIVINLNNKISASFIKTINILMAYNFS